ncbi:MAG: chemotaxis protein CheW [Polyangiaceae bacterium]
MIVATNQYITFQLDDEIYALDVAHAREIVEVPRLTRMPNAPMWIRGVMNLRGSVVPVIDLKHKFDMGSTEITPRSCVLIVEFEFEDSIFTIGVLVDAVLAVFELPPQQIEMPPKFGARYSRKYLKGVGRRDERVFMILEANEVFADIEVELDEAEQTAQLPENSSEGAAVELSESP